MHQIKHTIGYTTGVFDLFHIGHLTFLKNAKSMCDKLIVAVSTDKLCQEYKNKPPIIPQKERLEIVKSIKYVDKAIYQKTLDKYNMWKKYKFNILFAGGNWKHDTRWKTNQEIFRKVGVKVIFLPYTKIINSSKIVEKIKHLKTIY